MSTASVMVSSRFQSGRMTPGCRCDHRGMRVSGRRGRRKVGFACLSALVVLAPLGIPPQTVVIPPCDDGCTHSAILANRLWATPLEGGLCRPVRVTRMDDYLAVAPGCDPGEVLLVSLGGDGVQPVGRSGEGPGERRRVDLLASDGGGRLLVVAGNRIQLYEGDHLVLDKRMPHISWARDVVLLPQGGFVVAATSGSRIAAGRTLHLFDGRGEYVRSFAPEPQWRADRDPLGWRRVATTGRGTILSAKQFGEYTFDVWNLTGDLLARYDRRPSVFQSSPWDSPNAPWLMAIREKDGLIWTLTLVVADPAAVRTAAETAVRTALAKLPANIQHLRNDTIIEAIDPRRGQVVARLRTDDALYGFLPGDPVDVWTYREQRGGEDRIEIFRLEIEGHSAPK